MTAIDTARLTKRYGHEVYAIDDISLTVEDGEVFGFLDPNGAGSAVLDIETPDTSLEDLFTEYTHSDIETMTSTEIGR